MLRNNKKAYGLIRSIGGMPGVLEGPVAQYDVVIQDAISALRKMDNPTAIPDIIAAFAVD